jgi:secreted trypsin-like serine protease
MKSGILSALLALALTTTAAVAQEATKPADTSDSDMIVGGWPAKDNEWPWQVRLYENEGDEWGFCGGSLIDSQWVLTAAHCVPGVTSAVIGYGSVDRDKQKRVASAMVISHPSYDATGKSENDVALIKLAKPVKFGKGTAKISLATNDQYKASFGEQAYVTGWGMLMEKEKLDKKYPEGKIPWGEFVPMRLMEVNVEVQDLGECRANYGGADAIPAGHLCAGFAKGGKDSCQGDSGGPLVIPDPTSKTGWTQLGVVSFGVGCARPQLFGAYTRADYFKKWIKSTIAGN